MFRQDSETRVRSLVESGSDGRWRRRWQRVSTWMLWILVAVVFLMLVSEGVAALAGRSGDTLGSGLFWLFLGPWIAGIGFLLTVIGRTKQKSRLLLASLAVAGVGIVSSPWLENFGIDRRVRSDIPVLEAAYEDWLAGGRLEPPVTRAAYAGMHAQDIAFEIIWGADGWLHRNGSLFVPSDVEPNREWLPHHRCRRIEEHFYYCSV